jgi:hypothetical protein
LSTTSRLITSRQLFQISQVARSSAEFDTVDNCCESSRKNMATADYPHAAALENSLGLHCSRFSIPDPTDQVLTRRQLPGIRGVGEVGASRPASANLKGSEHREGDNDVGATLVVARLARRAW